MVVVWLFLLMNSMPLSGIDTVKVNIIIEVKVMNSMPLSGIDTQAPKSLYRLVWDEFHALLGD